MNELFSRPVKQVAFWKQIQSLYSQGFKSKMCDLSTKQILDLIREQKLLCSDCGKKLNFQMPMTTDELVVIIAFIINPMTGMSCNDCYESSKSNGSVIAEESEVSTTR